METPKFIQISSCYTKYGSGHTLYGLATSGEVFEWKWIQNEEDSMKGHHEWIKLENPK